MDMTRSIKDRLISLILTELHNERSQNLPVKNSTILRAVIQSFVTMQQWRIRHPLAFYQDELEKPIRDQMSRYYTDLGNQMVSQSDCSTYMKKVRLILLLKMVKSIVDNCQLDLIAFSVILEIISALFFL